MSLFQSLHELALVAPLNILISDEGGGQLRVNVTPQPTKKSEQKLWPLSVAGTPAELDDQFAEAVAVYQPGALSVLDQARACASANNESGKPAALPAPKADAAGGTEKRGRGRPAKNKASDAGDGGGDAGKEPQTDPRQTSILDDSTSAGPAGADAPSADAPALEAAPQPADVTPIMPPAADDGVDMY
ncbi:PRTRC system protein E [Burkholderia gladioli]|uniref:PRTRC system protein E n=1 Tax=Burkholderia gladioli TaxID=28095 RepID=UPI002FE00B7D